ncbi:hypothetical protein HDV05_002931 [Chytridiales sp. JEL 0842]|nr:hypothetical protein HDV05_002931 [Chytridiales sp. JEL 0842]
MSDEKKFDPEITKTDLESDPTSAIDELLLEQYSLEGLDEDQARVRKLEMELNKKVDAKLAANPNKMPIAIFFIVPNEFAERLTPIFKNFLKYSVFGLGPETSEAAAKMIGDQANGLYHTFKSLCYVTPLIGSAISDSYLDKYKTIVSLSSVYCLGIILLTIFSIPGVLGENLKSPLNLFALLGLIPLGTGGIKPTVSAHGGDQFLYSQKALLNTFYNYFYMAINAGALITSNVSPLIKNRSCYGGENDCYPQAFGLLSALIVTATIVFAVGKFCYRVVPPAGKFLPVEIFQTGFFYLYKRVSHSGEEARRLTAEKYSEGRVIECFDMAKVFLVLSPAPLFWMGFDQNGSTWQDLGDQLKSPGAWASSEIVNNAVNALFVVILAPVFANFVYPFIEKRAPGRFGLLQRMIAGMLLIALSFFITAIIQAQVDGSCVVDPKDKICKSEISIGWQVLAYFVLTCGEILFSISGLNFSYIEVGPRLKSMASAVWLVYVAIGNALDVPLLSSTLGAGMEKPKFFILVGGVCVAAAVLQTILAWTYVPKAKRATAKI